MYLFAPSGYWMPPAPPAEEVVPGGDSVGWLFAYFFTLFGILWGTEVASTFLLRALGVGSAPTLLGLVTQVAIVVPIAGLCAYLFVTYVPRRPFRGRRSRRRESGSTSRSGPSSFRGPGSVSSGTTSMRSPAAAMFRRSTGRTTTS